MLLRLYLVLDLVRNNSEIYTKRGLVYTSGHLKRGGERVDLLLSLKIHINQNPGLCLAIFGGVVWLMMSYANYICEREGLAGADLTFWKSGWNTAFLIFRGGF